MENQIKENSKEAVFWLMKRQRLYKYGWKVGLSDARRGIKRQKWLK